MAHLSQIVAQRGVDPFTPDDFNFVASKQETDLGRLILVGGQAIETWGVVFDVLAPTGDRYPLTEDTDWLGSAEDAKWLCNLLGLDNTEIFFPSVDDMTPSSALAYLSRPGGRIVMMDFLHSIVGPKNEKVRKLAMEIVVGGTKVRVLHPLLCLESRMANLRDIPAKRRGNGPMQAVWAVNIVRAFLRRNLEVAGAEATSKACHFVRELAEFKLGRFCFLNFDLDPLLAVESELVHAIGGRFALDDWPRVLERVRKKRDRWERSKR